jgi:DNA-directed RNA polymerase subunit RPC12/RpoP
MNADREKDKAQEIVVSASDILFECPSCGKSLVVEEEAEGMIISCPKCQTSIIVPPKQEKSPLGPPPQATRAHPPKEEKTGAAKAPEEDLSPQKRLAVLAGQLKEIQTQRTEISNRIASRLNEVNRDLVMLARLETSQQQILSEWTQLNEKIASGQPPAGSDSAPVVVGSSVAAGGRSRVSFRQ